MHKLKNNLELGDVVDIGEPPQVKPYRILEIFRCGQYARFASIEDGSEFIGYLQGRWVKKRILKMPTKNPRGRPTTNAERHTISAPPEFWERIEASREGRSVSAEIVRLVEDGFTMRRMDAAHDAGKLEVE